MALQLLCSLLFHKWLALLFLLSGAERVVVLTFMFKVLSASITKASLQNIGQNSIGNFYSKLFSTSMPCREDLNEENLTVKDGEPVVTHWTSWPESTG